MATAAAGRPAAVMIPARVSPAAAFALDMLRVRASEGVRVNTNRAHRAAGIALQRADYISDFLETLLFERFEDAFGCPIAVFLERHPELKF